MSQIMNVIKNKNRVDKANKKRRNEELKSMRTETMYRARLSEDFKMVGMILEDSEVESVDIIVDQKQMSLFSKAIYNEELAEFNIVQDEEDGNRFTISRKFVSL